MPTLHRGQLLRSGEQRLQPAHDRDDPRFQVGRIRVQEPHRQASLPGMVALFSDPAEQTRPAGDRFVMLAWLDQAVVKTPPVIHQGDQPGGVLPRGQRLRGEATPAPLVLQLVEAVLAIAAVSVVAGSALSPEAALRQLRHIQHHRVRIDGAEPLAGISTIHHDQAETLAALNIKKPSLDAQMSLL